MGKLDASVQQRVVQEMYERKVGAGEILIKEGDTGLAASELYVVKEGEFEVLERRQGVNFRVNMKNRGDCFGEVSLMYSSPRGATVAATQDSIVWVLERDTFRYTASFVWSLRNVLQQSPCNTAQIGRTTACDACNACPMFSIKTRGESVCLGQQSRPFCCSAQQSTSFDCSSG